MNERYRLHGLNVSSEIPLFQRRSALAETDDLVIRWGAERTVPAEAPTGPLVAAAVFGERRLYTIVETNDGYCVRFHGTSDFEVCGTLRDVTCHPDPEGPASSVPILAVGTLLASVLVLRGHTVLHASAVQVGGRALAFVGRSGMGKSTLTALFTRRGAPLIADDILRVDLDDGHARCRLGTTEIRLRASARDLAEGQGTVGARETGDGRTALTPVPSLVEGLPLRSIVVPLPSRERASVDIIRLSPREALLQLARYPRVLGWTHPPTAAQQFALLGALVELVPMYQAFVPWGPPFDDCVVDELLDGLGLSLEDAPERGAVVPCR